MFYELDGQPVRILEVVHRPSGEIDEIYLTEVRGVGQGDVE